MSLRDYDNPITSFIVGVVLIVAAFTLAYVFAPKFFGIWGTVVTQQGEDTKVYDDMVQIQQDALTLAKEGKLDEAKAKLEALLESTQNETVYQQTRIALASILVGIDVTQAVTLYKEIAADELLDPEVRAGAVEEMGLLYMIPLAGDTSGLTGIIFSGDAVYANMYDPDPAISPVRPYILLFEYANSIAPRMLASAYVAVHNARVLWLLEHDPAMAGTEDYDTVVTRLKSRIDRNLAQLDALMNSAPPTDPYLARANILKGATDFYLFVTGNLSQEAFETATASFTSGFDLTAQDPSARYNKNPLDVYLDTLADLSRTELEAVQIALKPFVTLLEGDNAWAVAYLKAVTPDSVAGNALKVLAKAMPELQPFVPFSTN